MPRILTSEEKARLKEALTRNCTAPSQLSSQIDLLIVFGCADPEVALAAARLYAGSKMRKVIFSGGIGKDSGHLSQLGITEADFLASVALVNGLPSHAILLERDASNGMENARNSLTVAQKSGTLTAGAKVASLAPAIRCRRLFEELTCQAIQYPDVEVVAGIASGPFPYLKESAAVREALNEVRGLSSMHSSHEPRIKPLEEFQASGEYFDVVQLALAT
jgi:hypothetical protein